MKTRISARRWQTLSKTLELLRHLSRLAEQQIDILKHFCPVDFLDKKTSLCSLPDELLQMIFTHAGKETVISLSQVNTRIRSIALHTPVLWNSICNLQPRVHIDAFLRCAGHVPNARLSLTFRDGSDEKSARPGHDLADDYMDLQEFTQLVTPIRGNWEAVRGEYRRPSDFEQAGDHQLASFAFRSINNLEASCTSGRISSFDMISTFCYRQLRLEPRPFKDINALTTIGITNYLETVDIKFTNGSR